MTKFYTGLPNKNVFESACRLEEGKAKSFHSHLKTLFASTELRLGLFRMDLAERFGIPVANVSKMYRLLLKVLSSYLKDHIIWPERGVIRQDS